MQCQQQRLFPAIAGSTPGPSHPNQYAQLQPPAPWLSYHEQCQQYQQYMQSAATQQYQQYQQYHQQAAMLQQYAAAAGAAGQSAQQQQYQQQSATASAYAQQCYAASAGYQQQAQPVAQFPHQHAVTTPPPPLPPPLPPALPPPPPQGFPVLGSQLSPTTDKTLSEAFVVPDTHPGQPRDAVSSQPEHEPARSASTAADTAAASEERVLSTPTGSPPSEFDALCGPLIADEHETPASPERTTTTTTTRVRPPRRRRFKAPTEPEMYPGWVVVADVHVVPRATTTVPIQTVDNLAPSSASVLHSRTTTGTTTDAAAPPTSESDGSGSGARSVGGRTSSATDDYRAAGLLGGVM